MIVVMKIDKNLSSARRIFYSTYCDKKIFQKNFCVGCRCCTKLKFSNRHNSPPNGARESKIPPFDSESKTTSNFRKIDPKICFHFTNMDFGISVFDKIGVFG